jgi:hypothetical protein
MIIDVKYTGPTVKRRDAVDRREKLYFTGKPCTHGHIDQRYVTSYGCLSCAEMHTKKYLAEDPFRWARMGKSWRARNPQKIAEQNEKWKEVRSEYDRDWRAKNINKVRRSGREWAKRNRSTPEGKVASSMRVHIRRCVKEKNFKSFEIVGYNPIDLVLHLERQFTKGMSWSNYGKWHIDHIIPVKWFTDRGVFCAKEINALSNLRPLWAAENMKKKDNRTFLI